ncbi:MAG: hypothetical protein H7335_06560 [Massilia sp.]|nr:hypothetical protein [Massilia sp.]
MIRAVIAPAALAMLLSACASAPPPPGAQASDQRPAAAAIPGQSTRASVLAALGKTHKVAFDSGYQTWLYQAPRTGGRFAEFVILFDPQGVVRMTRVREPLATDIPAN